MSNSKVFELQPLLRQVAAWHLLSNKIVFTNGCFDLLHPGHVTYLQQAKKLGTKLIVGLNSDTSVKMLDKGKNRPIQNEESRAIILAGLTVVDAIVIFEEETPEQLIKAVKPDVLAKGGDWRVEEIVGGDFVQSQGGHVVSIPFIEGHSTTSIEEKIRG